MLKKYIYAGFAFCLFPLAAHAALPYGMAGCGLGSLVFEPDNGQLFASTTNATLLNQTFGITFGTSNCIEPTKAAALNAQEQFIGANYSALKVDIAKGDGETLKAFAATLGCSKEVYGNFAAQMQSSYAKIFEKSAPMVSLGIVEDTIKNNSQLSNSCSLAI